MSSNNNWTLFSNQGSVSISTDSSQFLQNVGLQTSVAANALTIALKQNDGSSNATSINQVGIAFRNATANTGGWGIIYLAASNSITIPSGTTIGTKNGLSTYIYVYALNNAGSIELAVSLSPYFDQGSVVTTTAISGGSSSTTLYSTTARTSVPVRLIGRVKISESTAGTWATASTEVSIVPFINPRVVAKYFMSGSVTVVGGFPINFDSSLFDTTSAVTTGVTTWKFTAPKPGYYQVGAAVDSSTTPPIAYQLYINGVGDTYLSTNTTTGSVSVGGTVVNLNTGDFIDVRPDSTAQITGEAKPYSVHVSIFEIITNN